MVVWLVGEGRSWSWRSHHVVGQLWIFVDLAENGIDLIGVWRCFRGWMRVVSCRGRRGAKKGVRLGKWWFAGCLNRKNLNLAKNHIGFHRQIQGFARPDRRRGPYEHFAGTSSGLEAGKQKKMHSITPCRKVYRRKGNVRILVGICQRTLIN